MVMADGVSPRAFWKKPSLVHGPHEKGYLWTPGSAEAIRGYLAL